MNNQKAIKFIENKLSKKRFHHSMATANFMRNNADNFKLKKDKAYLAGLLHDCAKEMSDPDVTSLAKKFNKRGIIKISYFDYKLQSPNLLHGVAAAEVILQELKIEETEILEAVCSHTTGGKGLSKLAKFTFMADFCEPTREYHQSKNINKLLTKDENFDKAYYYTYFYLLERLLKKQKNICMDSIEGYNEALAIWKDDI